MEFFQNYTKNNSSSEKQNPLDSSLFTPFVVKVLKTFGGCSFGYDSACYNPKFNMIIACPLGQTIQFFDATTFKPYENRNILKLKGSVTQIAFQPENDTYVLGTNKGFIYMYNVKKGNLIKWKNMDSYVLKIMFLNAIFFAFSLLDSKKLFLVNLENRNVVSFDLGHNDMVSLYHFTKRNLLFSSLDNGSVRIYRTNKLPDLQLFSSIQAHKTGKWILNIQVVSFNGKEYLITASEDWSVKIWHLIKGKMKLLRVIPLSGGLSSLIYLENYKIIVIAYESDYIQFFRFPSMKLEKTVDLKTDGNHYLFLMKDRNMIGVTDRNGEIEFIQLHPKEYQFIAEREEDSGDF